MKAASWQRAARPASYIAVALAIVYRQRKVVMAGGSNEGILNHVFSYKPANAAASWHACLIIPYELRDCRNLRMLATLTGGVRARCNEAPSRRKIGADAESFLSRAFEPVFCDVDR